MANKVASKMSKSVLKMSPAYMLRQHRARLNNTKCEVDCKPPLVNTGLFRLSSALQDCQRSNEITAGNRHLVGNLIRSQRVGGIVMQNMEDMLKRPKNYVVQDRLACMKENIQIIEQKNLLLAKLIQNVKPRIDTGNHRVSTEAKRKQCEECFQIPHKILNKYKDCNFALSMDKKTLHILLRPKVFFDLTLMPANRYQNGSKTLGRVVMQLYTEACPQVVLEFVRIFKRGTTADLSVLRLFPTLWLEAELSLKNSSRWIKKPKIEYDMRAIDHGETAGILSFAKSNLTGFKYGVLNFSISFRPLTVLNGKRVGFGKVIRGQKIIDWVQIFGTKNGKPTQEIKITKCGVVQ